MAFQQTPKGYLKAENPLPHNFKYFFNLQIDDATIKNATYVPLIMNDEGLVNADTVIANPRHGSFAESSNPYCYHDSIIPRMMVSINAQLTKGAIETDKIRSLKFTWMPVYTSFLNRLEAQDSKTAVQIEDVLELQHETVGKSVYPIWSGTDMTVASTLGIHANATTAFGGLTTNAVMENIVFDKDLFFDALQYYTNSPMLKKVIGRMHTVTLRRDEIYNFYSNNFTNPMVKRINDYTFCGILFHASKATSADQTINVATDVTAIDHIGINIKVRYPEWNQEFDQTSS